MLTELPDKSGVLSFSYELESNSTDIYYQHAAQCDSQFLYYKTDYQCLWSNGDVLYNSCLLWINLLKKSMSKQFLLLKYETSQWEILIYHQYTKFKWIIITKTVGRQITAGMMTRGEKTTLRGIKRSFHGSICCRPGKILNWLVWSK